MSENTSTGNYIAQAWLVILLALVYGGALAGVHVGVSGRILENKRNETYDQIPQLVPGAVEDQTREHVVEGINGRTSVVYEARDEDGARIGWILLGRGQGFADRIDLLVGLNAQLTLTVQKLGCTTGFLACLRRSKAVTANHPRDRTYGGICRKAS